MDKEEAEVDIETSEWSKSTEAMKQNRVIPVKSQANSDVYRTVPGVCIEEGRV